MRVYESTARLPDLLCTRIAPPYSQFVPWLLEHSFVLGLFFRDLFANRISAFFAMDVIVSAIVVISFIQSERNRLRVPLLWLPAIETLIVGVSFGLPLSLFLRQVTLDRTNAEAQKDV